MHQAIAASGIRRFISQMQEAAASGVSVSAAAAFAQFGARFPII
jgi:hypothetical protein